MSLSSVVAEDFDVAQLTHLPTGAIGSNAAPHAYGFVYRRILRDKLVPHVPVFVNTFYPPNQPTAARCFAFGQALGARYCFVARRPEGRGDRFGRPDPFRHRRVVRRAVP